jgi:hypothetical protein
VSRTSLAWFVAQPRGIPDIDRSLMLAWITDLLLFQNSSLLYGSE